MRRMRINMNAPDQELVLKEFFRLNPAPSEQQLHMLTDSLGLTKEILEKRIYELLSNLLQAS